MAKELSDITMMGVDKDTYDQMLKVAKHESKSVSDVASEALKKHLESMDLTPYDRKATGETILVLTEEYIKQLSGNKNSWTEVKWKKISK